MPRTHVSSQVLTTKPTKLIVEEEIVHVIGQPLKRKEDLRIISGRTRYVDDIKFPNILYGAVLRSGYAHARIVSIDTFEAENSPGVRRIFTFKDLPKDAKYLPVMQTEEGLKIERPVLADDEVCFVGETVAFVVAETKYQAEDALELIKVNYEPLPTVVDPEVAIKEGSPKSHANFKSNLVLVDTVSFGDVDSAFEKAAKVVSVDLLNQRVCPAPLEPRASIASFDPGTQMLNVWISHQGPFQCRSDLSSFFHIPENKIRVVLRMSVVDSVRNSLFILKMYLSAWHRFPLLDR